MRTIKCQETCVTPNQLNLLFQSRMVWRDLSVWTRAFLETKHGGLGDPDAIREKFNELLGRITNVINLVFGEQVADRYLDFSNNFFNGLNDLVDAQILGDTEAVDELAQQLHKNSQQAADFFAEINPYWSRSKWRDFFYQYTQNAIDESTTFLEERVMDNIDIFDKILLLSSQMGEHYAQGIFDYLRSSSRTIV